MNFKFGIQLCIILFIFSMGRQNISIFLLAMSIDSFFSAISFIINILTQNLTNSQILTKVNKLYQLPLIDRYLYYILLELIYHITSMMLWTNNLVFLYYSLLFTTCPVILNYLSANYLREIFVYIDGEKKKFIKVIISKQLTNMINNISKLCDIHSNVEYIDILPIFEDYDQTMNNLIILLKNFLITSLLLYFQNSHNKYYNTIIHYLYNYKTGEELRDVDIESAKKRFENIVRNKKWKNILKPDTLQLIYFVYNLDDDKQNLIEYYWKQFRFLLIKMFTIWTFAAFFDNPLIAPLLSLFILWYRDINIIKGFCVQYIFLIIAMMVGLFYKNYFLVSFICEFGYPIFVNRIMYSVEQYIEIKVIKNIRLFHHYNQYNKLLISIIVYICVYIYLFYNIFNYKIFVLNYIFYMINIDDNRKRLICISVLFLGILSEFNIIHMIIILSIFYLLLNIVNYYQSEHKDVILRKPLKFDIINSYHESIKKTI